MRIDVGIIGGTGIGDRLLTLAERPVHIPTPYGTLRGKVLTVDGRNVLLISRHSAGHKVPPHMVNYRAMAAGLQKVRATVCFSTAATGGLRDDWPNGTMVGCTDFLDLTGRNITMHDAGVVHTDFSSPFGARGRAALVGAAQAKNLPLEEGVYLCGNGPRYETPKEIQLYRRLGGDVVGMTAASEAIVMREVGIDYSCLAIVTNLAAGIAEQELSHEEVVEEMQRSGEKAVALLLEAVKRVEL